MERDSESVLLRRAYKRKLRSGNTERSRISSDSASEPNSRMLPRSSPLRQRVRIRRNFMFCVWTIIFIFYSLSSDQGSLRPGPTCANALSLVDEGLIVKNLSSFTNPTTDSATVLPIGSDSSASPKLNDGKPQKKQKNMGPKYGQWEVPGVNCTPPGIDDFPTDLFSPAERQQGYVVIHFLVSMYIFYALALVCDDYFVPAMECICEELKLTPDIAGATFMAIATSAPELFTNIIGTFVTRGDIGIGAIVGSAVFNILAVVAVCGLAAGMIIHLEWYSVTRDCLFYSLSVILLIMALRDEKIYWYEALVFVCVYALYLIGMYNNQRLKRGAEKVVYKIQRMMGGGHKKTERAYNAVKQHDPEDVQGNKLELSEKSIQIRNGNGGLYSPADEENVDEAVEVYNDELEEKEHKVVEEALKHAEEYAEEENDEFNLFKLPYGHGCRGWFEWFLCWPVRAVYTVTVPDCREPKWRRWYPLTFTMCIIWIGVLSYVVNWMMTIIGHTLMIPDSVMGLTFIAAGTSIPEVVSSLIVSRQGLGTMALSNSIGSNTFDILMCLGLPWLIRASMIAQHAEINYIKINSIGLEYSAMMLITSLAVLYVILSCNKFVLDRKVGIISLLLYIVFLVMASLFELNVFFTVNLPTCAYHLD